MPKSLTRLEDVPRYGSVVESIRDGRRIVFIPGSDLACCELSIDKRGRKSTKASVLYQQGIEGSGRTTSANRKASFALIMASRKLRHYFQAHVINVMINYPLKKAMNKLEAAGQLIQWTVELSEFDIRYQPRHAIKAQALVDFIAEFTPSCGDVEGMEDSKKWVVHMDGSSTQYTGGI